MKRVFVLFSLLLCMVRAEAAITLHDDSGQDLILDKPARRIVSLAPNLTELLFAAGAGSQVVGAAAYSDYPAAARAIPRVGDSASLDIERIVALKPDLVVAWMSGNPPGAIAKLERLGLRVLVLETHDLPSIATQIEILGRAAGSERHAASVAAKMRAQIAALRREYRDRRKVSVFYQVWFAPLMTINGRQVISDVIQLCGGENIFADMPTLVPTISMESVLAANPEAIVTAADAPAAQALGEWQRWKQLRAVRDGHLLAIPADDISRPTPRLLDGARLLCKKIDAVRHDQVAMP